MAYLIMLEGQNTIEQQEVVAAFEEVRENTKGFDMANKRLDEFFDSLFDNDDQIDTD